MKRVVLIGSESTGKTTLAERLARHYGVSWVPEFVRDYAAAKGALLEASDVDAIARGQVAREDEHRSRAEAGDECLLIGDTDLLSTAVYAAHYYGRAPEWVVDAARHRRPDLHAGTDRPRRPAGRPPRPVLPAGGRAFAVPVRRSPHRSP